MPDAASQLEILFERLAGEMRTGFADIKGEIKTLAERVTSTEQQLSRTIEFGDRQNAQLIQGVKDEAERAHLRINNLEARTASNRRFLVGSVAIPLMSIVIAVVAVVAAFSR
jgi:hypothetical protein